MSSITKLGISGIRSYSPHRQEVIIFQQPVTLILGRNGSGKTTIIECLRCATSGSLPPGSNAGRSFLTDPDLVGQADVTGTLKLMFNAVNKHPILCIRSMTYRRRGDKHELKKTEQVLKSKTPEGKSITVNYNVNELDRQMPELLGVSSAVLENVLFCHQEDSLWPFKENTVLKTIFDELFQTTKFSKVQETLKNLTKDKRKKLKDQKHASDLLKHRYDTLYSDMQKVTSLSEQLMKNDQLLQERKFEATRIKMDNVVEEEMRVVGSAKGIKEYQLKQLETEKQKIESVLGLTLEGILIESHLLDKKIADIDTLTKELEGLKSRLELVTREVEDFKQIVLKCEQTLVEDVAESSIEARRKELASKLAEVTSNSDAPKRTDKQPEDSVSMQRANSGTPVDILLSQAIVVIIQLGSEISAREESLVDERELLSKMTYEHKRMLELSQSKLASLHKLVDATNPTQADDKRGLQLKLEQAESDFEKCNSKIAELHQQIDSAFETISYTSQLRSAQAKGKQILEIRKKETSLSTVVEALQKIVQEAGLDLKLLQSSVVELRGRYQKQEVESKDLMQKRDSGNSKLTEQEQIMFRLNKEIRAKEIALKQVEEELAQLVGADNANQTSEEGIAAAEQKVRSLDIELATAKHIRLHLLPGLLTQSMEEQSCKLCFQAFPEKEHVKASSHMVNATKPASNVGERKIEADLEKAKSDLEKLRTNRTKIQQRDLLRFEVESDNQKMKELTFSTTSQRMFNMQVNEEYHKSIEREKYLKEILDLAIERDTLAEALGLTNTEGFVPRHSGRSSEGSRSSIVPQDESDKSAEFKNLEAMSNEFLMELLTRSVLDEDHFRSLIENNRRELKSQENQRQSLHEQINQLKELLKPKTIHEFGSESKNHKYAVKTRTELMSEINDEVIAQQNAVAQFAHDKSNIQMKESKLNETIESKKNLLRELQYVYEKLSEEWRSFQTISGDNKSDRARLTDAKSYLHTKSTEQGSLIGEIKAKTQTLEFEKNIVQLLKLKEMMIKMRVEIDEDARKIQQLQHKLELERRARERFNALQTEISKMQGIEQTLETHIGQLCSTIHENKHVERDYFEALTDYEYLRDLVTDMEFMGDSVDKALAVHHQEQIELVNKTIASLWKYTYKGDDIKTVEIKTEPLNEPKSNTRSSNFNYRVVFKSRDDTELEMRGRSSMGQKVLASIVIRVALAQAFGVNCGVLALDEPTTNLDEPNIEGLAKFLSDLIDQQADNNSFQLVIITHDDHFIKLFRKYTDTFYLVSKDAEGYSKIEKKDLEKY